MNPVGTSDFCSPSAGRQFHAGRGRTESVDKDLGVGDMNVNEDVDKDVDTMENT